MRTSEHSMLVTTTSSLDGWDVTEYLGVASSHVVAGTGIFSDIFADLSDFFGGRSGSYQRQLAAIDREAIALLKGQAALRGGNALIGLRVDHDEISGKGKSMLMCTAQATIVVAVRKRKEGEVRGRRVVDADAIIDAAKRKEMLATFKAYPVPDSTRWKFIIDQRAEEFLPWLIETLPKPIPAQDREAFNANAEVFLRCLPIDAVRSQFCAALATTTAPAPLLKLIDTLRLGDLQKAQEYIDDPDPTIAKRGLALAECHQDAYAADDVATLSYLVDRVPQRFPLMAATREEKGLLGKREVWDCPHCSAKVDARAETCGKCSHDAWGMGPDDPRVMLVHARLEARLGLLRELLSASGEG